MSEDLIALAIWLGMVGGLIYWLWKLDWGSSP
jgi:hypothetical protein